MTGDTPLAQRYSAVLFDLDGVLYAGSRPIPGAPRAVSKLHAAGSTLGFVTNNAARTPVEVAGKLTELGIPATPGQVVTSAQAAARLLADTLPGGSKVLVVGGAGLIEAVTGRGLRPVFAVADEPAAVVQGFHPDLGWRDLAEGAYAVTRGAVWVASNTDRTLPTDEGFAPGNGALVEAIRMATGRSPRVAGKPERPVFDEALGRVGSAPEAALVIGDRLDTDIAGARNAGLDSLLVLSGVTRVHDLLIAPVGHRPDYIASDLSAIFEPYRAPAADGGRIRCGDWLVDVSGDRVRLDGGGPVDEAIRALAAYAWWHADPNALDFGAVDIARQ